MRQYFNWLLGKPLTPEIRSLVDAINSDQVKWAGDCYDGVDVVVYNGVRVCAYRINSNYSYAADIGFCSKCLPRHEAKAVYKALARFRKRREEQLDKFLEFAKREEVRKTLSMYTNEDTQP